ncbi:hypothetical protein GBA52_014743 [Prunus armeniaca]|nr:hypothetical protein GBA52_014743 [Prunus armeniaca]
MRNGICVKKGLEFQGKTTCRISIHLSTVAGTEKTVRRHYSWDQNYGAKRHRFILQTQNLTTIFPLFKFSCPSALSNVDTHQWLRH